jgi:hypothetical protein
MLLHVSINEEDSKYKKLCMLSSFFLYDYNRKNFHSKIPLSKIRQKDIKVLNLEIDDYIKVNKPQFIKTISTHTQLYINTFRNLTTLHINDLFFEDINLEKYPNVKNLFIDSDSCNIKLSKHLKYLNVNNVREIDLRMCENLEELRIKFNFVIGINSCKKLKSICIIPYTNISFNNFDLEKLEFFPLLSGFKIEFNECKNLKELTIGGNYNSDLDLRENSKLKYLNIMSTIFDSNIISDSIINITLPEKFNKKIDFKNLAILTLHSRIYTFNINIPSTILCLYIYKCKDLNLTDCSKLELVFIDKCDKIIFPKINVIQNLTLNNYNHYIDFQKFKNCRTIILPKYTKEINLYKITTIEHLELSPNFNYNLCLETCYDLKYLKLGKYRKKLNLRYNENIKYLYLGKKIKLKLTS